MSNLEFFAFWGAVWTAITLGVLLFIKVFGR